MKNQRWKTIILQWGLPVAGLVIVLGIVLIRFSVISQNKERLEVKNTLTKTADEYAAALEKKIEMMTVAAQPLAALMENYTYQEVALAMNAAASVVQDEDIYMVVMSNANGEGITNSKEQVNIKDTEYFAEAGAGQKYLYSADDGVLGKSCIISVVPMRKNNEVKGYMFVYYDLGRFEKIFKKMEFETSGFYVLVDGAGRNLCSAGAAQTLIGDKNFWNLLLADTSNRRKAEIKQAHTRFQNGLSGTVTVEDQGRKKLLVFSSVKINDWMLILGMDESYVDKLQDEEWKDIGQVMMTILICFLLFVLVLIGVNTGVRIRDAEKKKDLAQKAELDLLTGLSNKVATENKITEHLEMHPNEQGVLFVLDIDNFKKINDTMGHAFGDEVLRTIGKQIRSEFRVTDIVGRTGGDEFMIYLKNIKEDEIIQKEAKKLEEFFRNFRAGEYVKYSATASIGAAVFPRDAKDFMSLYKAADKALYQAKRGGKNQLAFYSNYEEA